MMKKISNIAKCVQPSVSSLNMLAATTLTLSMMGLIGCQSTTMPDLGNNTQSSLLNSQQQSVKAKAQLQKALEIQLRSSFSFQTDFKISNARRLQALENATPEQLANAKDKEDHCENSHDIAYVSLLKTSKLDGNDIEDDAYNSQRDTLKEEYQECDKSYDEWYDSYHYGDNKEEYLPNYDSNHTAEDLKKSKNINEYLLKPLEIKMTGLYQPLKGKMALMPSAKFETRNLLVGMNQPTYIDIKAGNLYLWAESFAYPTSILADEKLGNKWQNKWLKVSLNDGTLPEKFGKNLIKSWLKSQKISYEKTPTNTFSYVSKSDIKTALPYLSEQDFNTFANSNTIISRHHSKEINERVAYFSSKTLYDEMYHQYPEFLSYDRKKDAEKEGGKKYATMSSASLVIELLNAVKTQVDSYESEFMAEDGSLIDLDSTDKDVVAHAHYGLNGKKITWTHVRFEFPEDLTLPEEISSSSDDNLVDESMFIDSMTTFSPASNAPFANLPADVQVPNENNSIDAREYMGDLVKHYQDGNGTLLGKIVFQSFGSYLDRDKKSKESSDEADESEELTVLEEDTAAEATKQVLKDADDTIPDETHEEANKVAQSTSKVEVFTRTDIISNEDSNFEPAQCVLMSVSVEMMCEAEFINMDDSIEVAGCLDEQVQMQKVYESICQST